MKNSLALPRSKATGWPLAPALLIGLALMLFALPDSLEGRTLVAISPGHALSVLDTVALAPLLAGTMWLYGGLFQRRDALSTALEEAPARSAMIAFGGGVGLGLLLASAFSSYFWWWAVGASVFLIMNIVVVFAVVRRRLL